jgi:tetratricopeptide (TPR) repeat protein
MLYNLRNKIVTALLLTLFSFQFKAQDQNTLITAFSKSYEYETLKNYNLAINSINGVYSETSYEINLRLGWLHFLNLNYKESIAYYQKAIAIMPAATEPKWGILNPYAKNEDASNIEKTYLSILKVDSKNASANYKLGLIYFYKKDYINAKKHFDVVLNQTPFNYNYLIISAWTNYYLGNKKEASVLFNKTLLYNPKDNSALEGLSLIK